VRRRARFAGVIAVISSSLVSCAGGPISISPTVADNTLVIDRGATDQVRAGLTGGGYGPPQSMQQAQQTLSQQGRAGNPNYTIVNGRGTYVYAVGDH
jgi:hypothetical protein